MSRLGKLITENFKRLKLVEVDFDKDRNMYKITGKNKQGKSSILDSIWCALCGKREFPDEPIRKGEDEFKTELYFDDLTVKRVYTENSHRLEVYDDKGNKYSSPQSVLNGLFNKIGLMPRKFVDADKEKQVEMLMDAVEFDFDKNKLEEIAGCSAVEENNPIDTIDSTYQKIYDQRTEVNKKVKNAKENYKSYADVEKTKPVNFSDLVEEKEELQEENSKINELEQYVNDQTQKMEELDDDIGTIEEEIRRLKQKLRNKKQEKEGIKKERDRALETLKEQEKVREKNNERLEEINQEIKEADKKNEQAQRWKEKQKYKKKYEEYKNNSEQLTQTLDNIEEFKNDMLANTEFPIEGLSFKNGEVYYNDIPFSQASETEQLEISIAITKAKNPDLKLMLIQDGNTIDSEHMERIRELVREDDFVVLMEYMNEDERTGIVIEDGQIKRNNYEEEVKNGE